MSNRKELKKLKKQVKRLKSQLNENSLTLTDPENPFVSYKLEVSQDTFKLVRFETEVDTTETEIQVFTQNN